MAEVKGFPIREVQTSLQEHLRTITVEVWTIHLLHVKKSGEK